MIIPSTSLSSPWCQSTDRIVLQRAWVISFTCWVGRCWQREQNQQPAAPGHLPQTYPLSFFRRVSFARVVKLLGYRAEPAWRGQKGNVTVVLFIITANYHTHRQLSTEGDRAPVSIEGSIQVGGTWKTRGCPALFLGGNRLYERLGASSRHQLLKPLSPHLCASPLLSSNLICLELCLELSLGKYPFRTVVRPRGSYPQTAHGRAALC